MTRITDASCGCDRVPDWIEKIESAVTATSQAEAAATAAQTAAENAEAQVATAQAAAEAAQTAVTAETTARQAADTEIRAEIAAEATARTAANNTLQGKIDTEASTRSTADANLQTQITANDTDIAAINSAAAALTTRVTEVESVADATTHHLITEIDLALPGTGQLRSSVTEEGGTVHYSNTVNLALPTAIRTQSGSTERTFKVLMDLSDGTVLQSNDLVMPEGGGTEVTVTGITATNPSTNTWQVNIVLSDGTEISTNPLTTVSSLDLQYADSVITMEINGLTRSITLPAGTVYSGGTGITVSTDGTIAIDDSVVLTVDTTGLTATLDTESGDGLISLTRNGELESVGLRAGDYVTINNPATDILSIGVSGLVPIDDYNTSITQMMTDIEGKASTTALNDVIDDVTTAQASIEALQTTVAGKQDTLTAGDGIQIVSNVISTTGSSYTWQTFATESAFITALMDSIAYDTATWSIRLNKAIRMRMQVTTSTIQSSVIGEIIIPAGTILYTALYRKGTMQFRYNAGMMISYSQTGGMDIVNFPLLIIAVTNAGIIESVDITVPMGYASMYSSYGRGSFTSTNYLQNITNGRNGSTGTNLYYSFELST